MLPRASIFIKVRETSLDKVRPAFCTCGVDDFIMLLGRGRGRTIAWQCSRCLKVYSATELGYRPARVPRRNTVARRAGWLLSLLCAISTSGSTNSPVVPDPRVCPDAYTHRQASVKQLPPVPQVIKVDLINGKLHLARKLTPLPGGQNKSYGE